MRIALVIAGLLLAYRWLSSRRPSDVVSLEAVARAEARLRLGEPLPVADQEEVARLRERWERTPKVRKFYRPEHRYWKAGA